MPDSPTIVLVHGAFADASSWSAVHHELEGDGLPIVAPPNPLRGLAYDAAYTSAVVDRIDGPVILVGHSYGGAVITVAGAAEKVVGLVYVAGYAPDEGEALGPLGSRFADPPLLSHLQFTPFPVPGADDAVECQIDPAEFPAIFAADLPRAVTEFLAISQRPLAAAVFEEPAAAAAWKSTPSWGLVPTGDTAINPDLHRFSYERAGMTTIEVEGASHAVALSQPKVVADFIRKAVVGVGSVAGTA
jgi:pimeloyl-ACP methyl ester carboxylesterase